MGPQFRCLEGAQPYAPIIDAMQTRVAAIRADGADEAVWLLEHAPVYTGGTSALDADLLIPSSNNSGNNTGSNSGNKLGNQPGDVPTFRTGRGGQWTYHGPGQRVAYVMLDLQARKPDVRAFVHNLEAWIIDVLAACGVASQRRAGLPGIWVESGHSPSGLDKIAAIGVRISRWVTWHGIAINNTPDLRAFDAIVPCGVRDGGVTSLAALGKTVEMAHLDRLLEQHFVQHFPKD
jgi:lipoyl(octanoyl) transferase